jgi:hypothetical protein
MRGEQSLDQNQIALAKICLATWSKYRLLDQFIFLIDFFLLFSQSWFWSMHFGFPKKYFSSFNSQSNIVTDGAVVCTF